MSFQFSLAIQESKEKIDREGWKTGKGKGKV